VEQSDGELVEQSDGDLVEQSDGDLVEQSDGDLVKFWVCCIRVTKSVFTMISEFQLQSVKPL